MLQAHSVIRIALLALALVAFALWGRSVANRTDAGVPQIRLANAQTSRDALIERLVEALCAGDRKAVEGLRVDENEYRRLIMPGSVEPGQPPQIMPDHKSEYFWKHHNTLSGYTLDNLIGSYTGKKCTIDRVEVARVQQFAWYTAHRDPIIYLKNEDSGGIEELQVGSIAEYNGRFKFISYRSD